MKALIICAGESKNLLKLKEYANESDLIICADGGYKYALMAEIVPDIIIGDFDSFDAKIPGNIEKIELKREKDETDTQYAFLYAIKKGADDIAIYAGLGGRLDHTYSNIALLENTKIKTVLTDGKTTCYMTDSVLKLNGKKGEYVSVFSFSDISYGVNIKGLKYSLTDYDLKKEEILGVSNEFLDSEAYISVEKGKLLIICN